ncbi:MAG: hypothetical protein ING73_03030 [Rhodocyclaceae bacterium]|nr:hypothetical protein [Rhodocyclaceae bacterium]MCA3024849.1 hypothetical protein [Rhodocyclaceae bacterium]MCA3032325.1 hypothetical protein [Rhodocyclaceae bacterium]MCA3037846.1 hypothetical protein [Rhodocyclaceae bacterium]MCA3045897.1 hypothetical protein [Rhodocyclaceae bacterium]
MTIIDRVQSLQYDSIRFFVNQVVLQLPPWAWGCVMALAVATWLSAGRLRKFSHPAHPRFAKVVRDATAVLIHWPTSALLTMWALAWLVLCAATLQLKLVDLVWTATKSSVLGMGIGGATGFLLGLWFVYVTIPGWERPKRIGADSSEPKPLGSYDPERYFRVE